MRLLIVNANTSAHVTDMMTDAALAVPVPDLMVRGVTPETGPAIIATRLENEIAARGVIELAAREADEADAVLLGVSYDTGLRALRQLLDVPVVGMTEAALVAARMAGERIGLLGLGAATEPLYRDVIAASGFGPSVAAWRFTELPAAFEPGERGPVIERAGSLAADFARDERLDAVVLLGAVMAGATARLAGRTPVPVLDGITAGVLVADMMVRLALSRPTIGAFAPVTGRTVTGVDPALAARLAARRPGG